MEHWKNVVLENVFPIFKSNSTSEDTVTEKFGEVLHSLISFQEAKIIILKIDLFSLPLVPR